MCRPQRSSEEGRLGGLGLTRRRPHPGSQQCEGPGLGGFSQGRRAHRGHLRAVSWGSGQSPEGPSGPELGPVGMWQGGGGGRSGFWKLGALWRRGHRQVRAADSARVHAWERTGREQREQGSDRRSPGGAGSVLRVRPPPAGGQVSGPEARLTPRTPTPIAMTHGAELTAHDVCPETCLLPGATHKDPTYPLPAGHTDV